MLEYLLEHPGIVFGFVVTSFLLICGLMGLVYYCRREKANTESTLAVIFKVEEIEGDAGRTYKSWARFEVTGRSYEVADQTSSFPATHDVGDQVTVYYPPHQPERAFIGRWRSMTPFVFMGILGAAGFVAVVVYVLNFK